MLTDVVISRIVDAILGLVIEQAKLGENVRKWLGFDPAKLAFKKSFVRAYTTFVRHYPELVAELFNKSFLTKEATHELAKLLTRSDSPNPVTLATLWYKSLFSNLDAQNVDKKYIEASAQWLGWLEAELKTEEVFRPIFNSRELETLPRLEEKIDRLAQTLHREFEASIWQAQQYESVLQKVVTSAKATNVSVTANYYFSGEYSTLDDLYINPHSVFERVHIDDFVGREWLEAQVDNFLTQNKSGVFLLVGEAGVGKTAFMAHLVKERRYPHVFGNQVSGDANVSRALQSLGVQLVTRYQIESYLGRNSLPQIATYPDFLDTLLLMSREKCSAGEKIVLLCDALDEGGVASNGNVFGLPNFLPDGVYLILSQRPVNVRLNIDAPIHQVRLEATSQDNLSDIQAYLRVVVNKPSISSQIQARRYSEKEFLETLAERSEGLMMYLRYVIEEIENGSLHALDLESLPSGLAGYYAGYWSDWREGKRGEGKIAWAKLYGPVLGMIGAVQEPVSIQRIAEWGKFEKETLTRLLLEDWRAFLVSQTDTDGNSAIYPYHASFQDFIRGKINTEKLGVTQANLVDDLKKQTSKGHQVIVDSYKNESLGDWADLLENGYAYHYLATHFSMSDRIDELYTLLTVSENWAKIKYVKVGHYDDYRLDLEVLKEQLLVKEDLSRLIRTALSISSVISSSGYIDENLIALCVKKHVFSPSTGMVYARQKPNFENKLHSILSVYNSLSATQKAEFSIGFFLDLLSQLKNTLMNVIELIL